MTRRGWVLFAVMCVVWGIPYLLIKVAVGGVSVPVVVFARTALAKVRAGTVRLALEWRTAETLQAEPVQAVQMVLERAPARRGPEPRQP